MATINSGRRTPAHSSTPYPGIPWKSTPSTVSILRAVWQWARRAVCGPAPTGLKAACGAAARPFRALTPGPLRALKAGTAVRPVACPTQCPPRPTAATTGHLVSLDRARDHAWTGAGFTRAAAPLTSLPSAPACHGQRTAHLLPGGPRGADVGAGRRWSP